MAQYKCTICAKPTSTKCSMCKAAPYCSTECQQKDRALHKLLCSQYRAFLETRPEPNLGPETYDTELHSKPSASNHRLAILFPTKGTAPELIWLNYITHGTGSSRYESLYHEIRRHYSIGEAAQITQEGPHVEIWMADDARLVGPLTESIATLNIGYEFSGIQNGVKPPIRWGGDNVITGVAAAENIDEEEEDELRFYRDVTLADFRRAFDWYARENDCYEHSIPNPYVLLEKGKWIKAVKISSSLDMQELNKKKYIKVKVKNTHYIFRHPNGISQAARAVGFPLLAMKFQLGFFWASWERHAEHNNQPENKEVSFLIMSPDIGRTTTRENNAKYSKWDEKPVATTIVARQDKKDLTAHQGRLSSKDKEDAFKEYMRSNKFATFFDEFKQKKISEGEVAWMTAVVPPNGVVRDDMDDSARTVDPRYVEMMRMMGML
ncbi:hypothetical protein V8E51_019915 [Hyaloscypha variabilis]